MSDDLISRSALLERIDDIYDCCDMTFDGERDHACKPEDCKGCKWYDTKQYIRKMVQNAPAVDAVDADKALEWLEGYTFTDTKQIGK